VSRPGLDVQGAFLDVVEALEQSGVPYAFIGLCRSWPGGAFVPRRTSTSWWRPRQGGSASRGPWRRAVIRPSKQIGPADSRDLLPDIAMFRADKAAGTRVDVFIAKTDFERAVIASARSTEVLGATVRLACPEASIIYKLLAQRTRDLDDSRTSSRHGRRPARRSTGTFSTTGPTRGASQTALHPTAHAIGAETTVLSDEYLAPCCASARSSMRCATGRRRSPTWCGASTWPAPRAGVGCGAHGARVPDQAGARGHRRGGAGRRSGWHSAVRRRALQPGTIEKRHDRDGR
jgi:hypothetical protein